MCPPLSLCRIWIAFLFVGSEKAFDVVVSAIRQGAAIRGGQRSTEDDFLAEAKAVAEGG